jgi:hypothetical protein
MGPRGAAAPPPPAPGRRWGPWLAALCAAARLLHPTPASAAPRPDAVPAPAEIPVSTELAPPEPSQPPSPTAERIPAAPEPTLDLLERPDGTLLGTWIDLPHAFIERRLYDVANGFDRFFADERDIDCLRPSSFVRWRHEVRLADDGTLAYGNNLRADLSLPHLKKRLRSIRIVLENAGRSLNGGEPNAATAPGQEDGGRADAAVRWTLLETLRSSIDVGAGILFDLPPGLVARTRFRIARELGSVALARVASSGFWNTRDGLGFNASLALERPLVNRLLLRWSTGTLRTQVSSGWESSSELALLATLSPRTGLTLLGSASGQSKPDLVLQTWRVAARLRTALYRRWVYGEIEPEVRWPLDADGDRRATPAVMFRVELQFEDDPPDLHADAPSAGAPTAPVAGASERAGCPVDS